MSKSLKEVGLREAEALRRRVRRDWSMNRISKGKCERLLGYLLEFEKEVEKEE